MTSFNNIKFLLIAAFFLSGLSALVYEVLWMRMLTITFGSTVFSAATVITAFMGGLAAGSFVAGKYIDKLEVGSTMLKLYAILEIFIGIYCLFTPVIFYLCEFVYGFSYTVFGANFYFLSIVKFLISFAVLVFPTFLMGASLPVVSKFIIRHKDKTGSDFGFIYSINTFGAVIGVVLSAFLLIPLFGVRISLFIAVFINIAIGVLLYYFPYGDEIRLKDLLRSIKEIFSKGVTSKVSKKKTPPNYIKIIFFITGFAAIALEVCWFRVLSQTIGISVYAFAIMLSVFLFALGAGSIVYSFTEKYIKKPESVLIDLFALIAFLVVASIPVFGNLPVFFVYAVVSMDADFASLQFLTAVSSAVALFVPVFFMGYIFPLIIKIALKDFSLLGSHIGSLYSINTIGAVFGSFTAGFIFIPFVGVQNSVLIFAALYSLACLLSVYTFKNVGKLFKRVSLSLSIIVVMFGFLLPPWDKLFMTSGPYIYGKQLSELYGTKDIKDIFKQRHKLLHYKEGVDANVAVIEHIKKSRILVVNGKGIADTYSDVAPHRMLGILPILLADNPKDAVLLGVGSAVTLGAMEQFPLENIYAVDVSKEVLEAGEKYFSEFNYNAFDDSRVKVVIDDGRSFLAYNKKKYDVIISQVSVPWMPGASLLYTKDFYELQKSRLKEGGIAGQWIQGYSIAPQDFKALMKSFIEVYSNVSVWSYSKGSYFLIGSEGSKDSPFGWSLKDKEDAKGMELLKSVGLGSREQFYSGLMMTDSQVRDFVKDSYINTYDLPKIEFTGPQTLFEKDWTMENYIEMADFAPYAEASVKDFYYKKDDFIIFPYMGIKTAFTDNWRLDNSMTGYVVHNYFVDSDVPGSVGMGKSMEVRAVFLKKGDSLSEQVSGAISLRKGSEYEETLKVASLREIMDKEVTGTVTDKGSISLSGSKAVWFLSEGERYKKLDIAWQCKKNKILYTAEYAFISEASAKDYKNLLSILSKSIYCGL